MAIPSLVASGPGLRTLATFWQQNEAEITSQALCLVQIPRERNGGCGGWMEPAAKALGSSSLFYHQGTPNRQKPPEVPEDPRWGTPLPFAAHPRAMLSFQGQCSSSGGGLQASSYSPQPLNPLVAQPKALGFPKWLGWERGKPQVSSQG